MIENRKLTKQEVAAMWLHGEDYARRGIGAIAYYQPLSEYKKNNIDRMLKEIKEAPDDTPNLDLEKICPELIAYVKVAQGCPDPSMEIDCADVLVFAAQMLKLAEENGRLRGQNEILERNSQYLARKILAARKGDGDE